RRDLPFYPAGAVSGAAEGAPWIPEGGTSGDPLQENGAGDHVQRPVRVHGWLGVNVVAALASLREVPSQYGAGSLRRNVLLSRIDGGGDGPGQRDFGRLERTPPRCAFAAPGF